MAFFEKKAVAEEEKFMVEMRQEFDALSSASDVALRYEGFKNLAEKVQGQPMTLRYNSDAQKHADKFVGMATVASSAALAMSTGAIEALFVGLIGIFGTAFVTDESLQFVADTLYGPGERAMTKRHNMQDKIKAGLSNILNKNFEDLAASPRFGTLSSKYPELTQRLEEVVSEKLQNGQLSESFRSAVRAELITPKPMAAPVLSPLLKAVR